MEEIVKLQIIVQHQEETIASLSDELFAQQKELAKLTQQFVELQQRFKEFSDGAVGTDPGEEPPPPHY